MVYNMTKQRFFAIDPGPVVSGYYGVSTSGTIKAGVMDNEILLQLLPACSLHHDCLAIEMMEARGMPLGKESLETVFWAGRFYQKWQPGNVWYVFRRDVKLYLCGSVRAKDANIRQALIDIYGPPDTKKRPNPATAGVKSHAWAAMAVWHYASTVQTDNAI